MEGTVTISISDFEYLRRNSENNRKLHGMLKKCLVFEHPEESWEKGDVVDVIMTEDLRNYIHDFWYDDYAFKEDKEGEHEN